MAGVTGVTLVLVVSHVVLVQGLELGHVQIPLQATVGHSVKAHHRIPRVAPKALVLLTEDGQIGETLVHVVSHVAQELEQELDHAQIPVLQMVDYNAKDPTVILKAVLKVHVP